MNIFNSLGSNYSARFIGRALGAKSDPVVKAHLVSSLSADYGGRALLFYKGRDALYTALILSKLPKGSKIAINGFSCFVVYKAITQAGFRPVFVDIDPKTLHYSARSLGALCRKDKAVKAVIIQNTLGFPVDIQSFKRVCRSRSLILIEDLAHSAGGTYKGKKSVGTIGDMVILSFSQDKIIDGISGGALVIRNRKFIPSQSPHLPEPSPSQQFKDRLYPFFTALIRKSYTWGLGKILHRALRVTSLLSLPVQRRFRPHSLPSWYAGLIFSSLSQNSESVSHRRQIARIYIDTLDSRLQLNVSGAQLMRATFVRFPIFVKNRQKLIDYLRLNGVYVSDIWYDAPISPKKYLAFTSYRHNCPSAEKVAENILNLPTHRFISTADAQEISHIINAWSKSQPRK